MQDFFFSFSRFSFFLFCAEWGIVCFCVFCVRGGTSSVWDFCRDFCRMLVDGACGDIKCFSDLYAPRANRQIRVCFCDRRSHRKRIGSRIVFLKRLVEDERQGGISTGKLSWKRQGFGLSLILVFWKQEAPWLQTMVVHCRKSVI